MYSFNVSVRRGGGDDLIGTSGHASVIPGLSMEPGSKSDAIRADCKVEAEKVNPQGWVSRWLSDQ